MSSFKVNFVGLMLYDFLGGSSPTVNIYLQDAVGTGGCMGHAHLPLLSFDPQKATNLPGSDRLYCQPDGSKVATRDIGGLKPIQFEFENPNISTFTVSQGTTGDEDLDPQKFLPSIIKMGAQAVDKGSQKWTTAIQLDGKGSLACGRLYRKDGKVPTDFHYIKMPGGDKLPGAEHPIAEVVTWKVEHPGSYIRIYSGSNFELKFEPDKDNVEITISNLTHHAMQITSGRMIHMACLLKTADPNLPANLYYLPDTDTLPTGGSVICPGAKNP